MAGDGWYILDGDRNAVPASAAQWSVWRMEKDRRLVGREERNGITVSTVFLGLDHSYGDGSPLLFETMIFGGEHDEWQDRCSTWAEAEAMHKRACALAFPAA